MCRRPRRTRARWSPCARRLPGGVDGLGNYVLFPQSASAYTGAINDVTNDPIFRSTQVGTGKDSVGVISGPVSAAALAAAFFDMPDMSTPYTAVGGVPTAPAQQTQDLSSALAVKSVMNEYVNDASISAKTDWVFAMPTRRYQVAMDYSPSTSRMLYATTGTARHLAPVLLHGQHVDQLDQHAADLRGRAIPDVLRP